MAFSKKEVSLLLEHPLFAGADEKTVFEIFEKHGCGVMEFCADEIILSPSVTEKRAGLLLSGQATVSTADISKNTPDCLQSIFKTPKVL